MKAVAAAESITIVKQSNFKLYFQTQLHYVEGENNDSKKIMKNYISLINRDMRMQNGSLFAENLSLKNTITNQSQENNF